MEINIEKIKLYFQYLNMDQYKKNYNLSDLIAIK